MRTGSRIGTRGFATKRSFAAGMALVLALATRGTSIFAAGPLVQVDGVAHGNVTVNQTGAATVIHASNNAIINYKQFDIPAGTSVQFIQPNAGARVLNRINSATPSQINGSLSANGVVYLINPAGVIFGNGAVVNTAGIFAASAHLSDADFLSGTNHFTNSQGAVTNAGLIEAGKVVLVGQSVENMGTIVAPGGLVAFAAGDDVYVVENNNSLALKVTGAAAVAAGKAAVENSGKIEAPGGDVSLVAGDIYGLAVKNAGEVQARNITMQSKGTTLADGTLDASSSTGTGGTVKVLGDLAAVTGKIDASGATGGGTVLIGGTNQGLGSTQTATYSYVGRTADIHADALTSGNGGNVVVWSNQSTFYYGNITAKGGLFGGNGGNVEVSGHNLAFSGTVNLSAPIGLAGTLLLDPATIDISATGPGADDAKLDATGEIDSGNFGGQNLTISAADVVTNLGTGNVIMGATVSITVDGAITASTTNYLLLSVGGAGSIILNAPITLTGGGALVGRATAITANVNANVTVNTGGSIQNGADLVKSGGTLTIAPGTYAGNVTMGEDFDPAAVAPGLTAKSFILDTSSGAVTITGALTESNGSGLTFGSSGAVSIATTGTMAFNDAITLAQNTSLTPAGGVVFSSAITGATNDLTITGGGTFAAVTNAGTFAVSGTTNLTGNVTAAAVNFNSTIGGTSVGSGVTSITTTGAQTYGAVTVTSLSTVSAGVTFNSTGGGKIEFKGDVNPTLASSGGTLNDIVVTSNTGSIVFDGAVSNTNGFNNITLQSPHLTLTNGINFAGTLAGTSTLVTLAATTAEIDRAAVLLASGGTLVIGAAGTYGLHSSPLAFTTPMTLDVSVGAVTINGSLTDSAAVTLITAGIGSPLTTTGTQSWSAVTLTTPTALAGTTVAAGGTLTGATNDLTITGDGTFAAVTGVGVLTVTGNAIFNGNVSADTINVNTVSGATTINAGAATIATTGTTGSQTYGGAVTTAAAITFSSAGNGTIHFVSTLDPTSAPLDLTVTIPTGSILFSGNVGSTAYHNVTFNSASLTFPLFNMNGTASGSNTLVTVSAGGTLQRVADFVATNGTMSLTPGAGTYFGGLSITKAAILDTQNGSVLIAGSVDDNSALILGKSGATSVLVNAGGTQAYTSTVTLGTGTTLTSVGGVSIGSTLVGAGNDLTVNGPGTFAAIGGVGALTVNGSATFNGNVGTTTSISVTGASTFNTTATTIATSGAQTYTGTVAITSIAASSFGTTFSSTGGKIEFKAAVNPSIASSGSTLNALVVTANTGQIVFDSAVGNPRPFHNITLQSPHLTLSSQLNFVGTLAGTNTLVTLAATAAELDRAATLVSSGGTIVLGVAGSYTPNTNPLAFTKAMTLDVSVGAVTINSAITDTNPVILITGGLGSPLVSTGAQTWAAVTLNTAATFTAPTVNFGGVLTGGGNNLTVNGVGTFSTVGGIAALQINGNSVLNGNIATTSSINVTGSSTLNSGATSITTTGAQNYAGPVTTAGASTAFTGTGTIGFGSNLNPATSGLDLSVGVPGGTISFGGNVGVPTPYRNVTVNSSNLQIGALSFTGTFTGSSTTVTVRQGGTAQSAADFVTPGGTISLTPGAGTYAGGLAITKTVILDTQNGNVIIAGPITDTNPLTLGKTGATAVSLTSSGGSQAFASTVTLAAPTTLASASGVVFSSTLTGAGNLLTVTGDGTFAAVTGISTLTVTGNASFNGNVGATILLVNGSGGGTTVASGNTITTSGNQTYVGAVSVTGGGLATFTGTGGAGRILFDTTLTGSGGTLALNSAGTIVMSGPVSGFTTTTITVADLALTQPISGTVIGVGINTVAASGAASLQNAVDLITPNGVITVAPGNYSGSVTAAKPLTLDTTNGAVRITGTFTDTAAITLGKPGAASIAFGAGTANFGGPVTFTTPIATLTGNIVFSNKQLITGGSTNLTVAGNVSLDTTITLLSLNVTGSSLFLDPTINTSAGQVYGGAATLQANTTLNDSGSAGVHFASTINGPFALTINTTHAAANAFVLDGNVQLDGAATIGALTINSSGNITVHAVTASAGDITLTPNPVLLGASLSGDHFVSGSLFLYAPGQLAIEGDLHATAGNVNLGGGRTGSQRPGMATMFSDVPAVTISGGTVAMGPLERFVAAVPSVPGTNQGSITIMATSKAILGDITALNTISILAPNVVFLIPNPLPGSNNQQLLSTQLVGGGLKPFPSADGGLSFVSGNGIAFSPGAAFTYSGGLRSSVGFATANGTNSGGNVPGAILAWDLKTTTTSIPLVGAANSAQALSISGLNSGILSGPFLVTYLPLLSTGPSLVNPSNAIASVLPSQVPSPVSGAELSSGDAGTLHQLGIDVRSLDSAESEAQLRKVGVFDDVPGESEGSLIPTAGLASLKVAIARLPVAATHDLVETFRSIFQVQMTDPKTGELVIDPKTGEPKLDTEASAAKRKALATKIEAGWKDFQAYRDTKKDVPATGTEFRQYLEEHVANSSLKDNGEKDALKQLQILQGLYARLDAINLAPTELRKARIAIFRVVADPSVESSRGDPLNDQAVLESAVGVQPISLSRK